VCYSLHNLKKYLKHGEISGRKFSTLHSLILSLRWLIAIEKMIKKGSCLLEDLRVGRLMGDLVR
jgi:hypothetical protein